MAQPVQFKLVQEGESPDYTPSIAVAAGALVKQGTLVGIAPLAIAANVLGALNIGQAYDGVKTNGAIAAGVDVYWSATASPQGGVASSGALSATAGDTYLGKTLKAAGTTDETARFVLLQAPGGTSTQYSAVTDPGASGAIPVTGSGRIAIVTAGAETRTLAAPSFVGQEILIYMKTDGGDCVVTCATTINQAGNNTITLNDTGDAIRMTAVEQGSNLRWRLVINDGCALSTV